jgi:hypothetical protein
MNNLLSQEILDAFARLVGSSTNPGGFATLLIILLVFAYIAAFRTVSDGIKLAAFVCVAIMGGLLMAALVVNPSPIRPNGQLPNSPASPVSTGVKGWAYYEVGKDGRITSDGQLEPILASSPMPDFLNLKKGTILRAKSPVNLRAIPPKTDADLASAPVATLKEGQCVTVLANADPKDAVIVKAARSGGWLQVQTSSCAP